MMEILRMDRDRLLRYVAQQLHHTLPDDFDPRPDLDAHLDEALARLQVCINAVRPWRENQFNPLHSTQYCSFLYFLAHTIWQRTRTTDTPTRLFLLNKALNGIDLFYEIEMPPIFFIGHSVGIVFAKATYGNYLVVYQNSTVGKNHGVAPVLGEGVVMYAGTAIIGGCQVGDGTVLSQGTSLVNTNTPGHCTVYPGQGGQVVFKPTRRDALQDIFRR
jgi:serine O-acetyltransferase